MRYCHWTGSTSPVRRDHAPPPAVYPIRAGIPAGRFHRRPAYPFGASRTGATGTHRRHRRRSVFRRSVRALSRDVHRRPRPAESGRRLSQWLPVPRRDRDMPRPFHDPVGQQARTDRHHRQLLDRPVDRPQWQFCCLLRRRPDETGNLGARKPPYRLPLCAPHDIGGQAEKARSGKPGHCRFGQGPGGHDDGRQVG